MICPKCNMNIKDDSKFCMHCGTQFNVSMNVSENQISKSDTSYSSYQAPVQVANNQTSQQPVLNAYTPEQAQASKTAQEKYREVYMGSKYTSITNSNFSFGTFFFGWVWLLFQKLYGMAGKLFVTELIIWTIAVTISRFLGIIGSLIGFVATIYISYIYAQSFSAAYRNRANCDISNIMDKTQDEGERIRLCKKAGRPLYPAIILVFWPVIVVFLIIFLNTYSTIDNSRQDMFVDTSMAYINEVKMAVAADELVCGKPISEVESGIYYYSFTTTNGDSATKLLNQGGKSPWKNADVAGQVYILRNYNSTYKTVGYLYAIVLVDEKGRGFGEFTESGHTKKVIDVGGLKRSAVNTKDGDNRKIYYEKAKAGTKKALNEETAPTSDASAMQMTFKSFYEHAEGIEDASNKVPIACDIQK